MMLPQQPAPIFFERTARPRPRLPACRPSATVLGLAVLGTSLAISGCSGGGDKAGQMTSFSATESAQAKASCFHSRPIRCLTFKLLP